MHNDKITLHDHRAKVDCPLETITMVKQCEEEEVNYTRVRFTFHRIGTTRIQGANYLNENERFVKEKKKEKL